MTHVLFLLYSRELEHRYQDQIRDLQVQLSHEKDEHFSLSQEYDMKTKFLDSRIMEKESQMKDEAETLKKVQICKVI